MSIRRRACWRHEWTSVGAGAVIQRADSAVCAGDGSWHPGGVALASALQLSRAQDYSGFRLIIDTASGRDLLMGITEQPGVQPTTSGDVGEGTAEGTPILKMGYHYIMGRRLGADGEVRVDGSGGLGMAPRSIFYGGRSRRCCFAPPTMQAGVSIQPSGPSIDMGANSASPGKLAKLRNVGDWVEFSLFDGQLRATDYTGQTHVWGARMGHGQIWVPTVAWTGSRASVRLGPPELVTEAHQLPTLSDLQVD